jgi:FixJ family two-component response regulator
LELALGNRPLIAIVDDDASVRDSMRRLVASSGYNAKAYSSVDELLNSGQLGEISCIIADIQMPKATGFDMQNALKKTEYDIPIIFITAFPHEKGRQQALKAGAYCYLHKPVSVDELLHCVQTAVSQEGEIK